MIKPSLLIGLLALQISIAPAIQAAEKFNVVFILADDLGWADTTLYGHTGLYETPHLERLAARGMVFSRSYSAPLCSPTRAAILTGQNNTRNGSTAPTHHIAGQNRLQAKAEKSGNSGNKALGVVSVNRLDNTWPTLGKRFKAAGYATAHFGKWHLGPEPFSPLQHGFDVDIPHHNGPGPAGSFVAPWKYKNFEANKPGEHIEDRMAAEAVKWIKSLPAGQPFLLNYWQFSVHAPFDAKQEYIDQYRGKIDKDAPQRSPTYAAMVKSMDDAVGSLIEAVEQAGLIEKTIFIFTSDNGGNMYNGIRETDADGAEFITTPTSNRPLRGGKATIYEGGIRVPTVIAWPGLTQPASRSGELIHCVDFYPTLTTGLKLGVPRGHTIDGIDITPALRGGKLGREAIFTYFPHSPPIPDWLPPSICIHSGDWKLIRLFHQGENGAHGYRLYNLASDIGEATDLSAENPEMLGKLDALIEAHLAATQAVVPLPNPAFDPANYKPESIGIQTGGLKVTRAAKKPAAPKKPQAPPAREDGTSRNGTTGRRGAAA
jgi:arylsulfatase A-like enzyme